jgi:two-component system, OmpR family, sensor histidine kinase BaeS
VRTRLILSFVLVVLVSVGMFVIILQQSAQREVGAFMFRGSAVIYENIVESLENYYAAHGTWDGVESLFPAWRGQTRHGQGAGGMGSGMGMMDQRLRLVDTQGQVLVDSHNPEPTETLPQLDLRQATPLKLGRTTVGYLLPETSAVFTIHDQTNLVERLTRAAIIAGLMGGGLSLLLALLLSYRLARPVQELKRSAQNVAAGDLHQRVQVKGSDELASLGEAFNQMAESLQQAETNRRAMTADIAHELRTPLAVQRAHLEAIEDGIYPLNLEALEPILAQNRLLTRLVEDLRTLALAEAGQLSLDQTAVDLNILVERVVRRFAPQFNSNQVSIELDLPPGPESKILADPSRIEQIISNLLTNALRHTPTGGKIRLSIYSAQGTMHLAVHDSGPGIPEGAFERIFERFYRADDARSRSDGGTGLGLSIARHLAQAHQGDLRASNHPDGGAVFTLILPAASGS